MAATRKLIRWTTIINGQLRFYEGTYLMKEVSLPDFINNLACRLWEERGILPNTEWNDDTD